VETRIPASERTSQKLSELLTRGIAEGDARSELIKLAVRKIVEEALEAEVAEAVGRGYYESGAVPGAGYATATGADGCAPRRVPSTTACRRWPIGPSRSSRESAPAWPVGRRNRSQLAVEMYARGLSTRDIEAASRDASGARASRDASGARASRDASGASVETACSERPGAVKREA
jgi:hypothetical protein